MASVIQGYSYDIFISYRQKDNITADRDVSGWVSEFVSRLKKEIEATVIENISIYFDENPYDGILETHDVHDSLRGKLKCLIFIPIVSQTYCDPACFAWKHEFIPFKALSSADDFGMKVTLHNGNVTSRILPICIHDLEPADRKVIENEIGPLRSIDFIFKSPGVNRPLTPADKREDSSSKVIYKDQLNKVANAVKDIVKAMKDPRKEENLATASNNRSFPTSGIFSKKILLLIAVSILIIAAVVSINFVIRNSGRGTSMEKSIAVLPFVDMSSGHDMEYLGDGIAEEIINSLTSIRDLRIVGRTSSFQFKGEKLDLREIGKKLNVATVLEGSIQQSGGKLRITAQLVSTKDNSHFWSERYDVDQTDIFKIQDNIAARIVDKLNLTLSSQEQNRLIKKETTEEAYSLYLKALFQYKRENFEAALELLEKVVVMDSLYAPAHAYLGLAKAWAILRSKDFSNKARIQNAILSSEKAMALDPLLPESYSGRALIAWAINHDFAKARTYFEKSLELDPGSSLIKNRYGYFLTWMGDFDKASRLALEAMEIDPVDYNSYAILFRTYLYSGKLEDAYHSHLELNNVLGITQYSTSREIELNFYRGEFGKVVHLSDSLLQTGAKLEDSDLSYVSRAYAALHQSAKSEHYLHQLIGREKERNSEAAYNAARVFAFRKQADSCFSHLSRSIQKQEMRLHFFKIDPAFKDLRNDPRYIALYNEYGFDRY